MAEVSINLLHDLKVAHAKKLAKPPFFTGLRTGYIRAWLFVVFKVWLILTLVNGATTIDRVEKDIALLDSWYHDDFSSFQVYDQNNTQTVIQLVNLHHRSSAVAMTLSPKVAGDSTQQVYIFQPRGPQAIDN